MKVISILVGAAFFIVGGNAEASLLDNEGELSQTISDLRSAIGGHPRVLKIEIDREVVTIEAQDPHNLQHVNRWRCASRILGIIPLRWVTGPEPVDLQLVNPDLEANLFDLDAIAFGTLVGLKQAAIERAHLQDAAAITAIRIERQTFILPKPTCGAIRCTLSVLTGRERAKVFANAQGEIIGADVSDTQWAKSLNLFQETALIVDAATAFRAALGTERNLTEVSINAQSVNFSTNIPDKTNLLGSVPSVTDYSWDLNGLVQRLAKPDVNALMQKKGPAAFSIDEVDWTIIGQLEENARAKLELSQANVTQIRIEKSSDEPGEAVLRWTVEVAGPNNETFSAVADMKGNIKRVVLPESLNPKIVWTDPATLARAIARVGAIFGSNVKIVSIAADDRGAKITIDDPADNNQLATFDLTADGATRSSMAFTLNSKGERFGAADLAPLTEQKIATFEAEALKKLAKNKQGYLESVTVGQHLFVPQAGPRVVEVRIRDLPEDSAHSEYGWIAFSFDGRVLDFSTMD